jgi:zinc transporter 11
VANLNQRRRGNQLQDISSLSQQSLIAPDQPSNARQWKRMLMLIIAITVHNVPEGLAVGVGFGAIGSSPSATFSSAR